MTAPLFIVEAIPDSGTVVISGAEGRHAVSVKRLAVGEAITASDGRGRVAHGVVGELVGRDQLVMTVESVVDCDVASPRITVVQALAKGDRADLAIELMTEVGVDQIIPWSAARSIAQWKADKAARGVEKWQTTAREAAKQSRRAFIPEITAIESSDVIATRIRAHVAAGDLVFILHESAPESLVEQLVTGTAVAGVVLIIGPEGGISDDELRLFSQAGAHPARLGPDVLRTSTAGGTAIAVVSALTRRW